MSRRRSTDAGFSECMTAEHPMLVASLLVCCGDVPLAIDAAEEAFAQAAAARPKLGAENPRVWLLRTGLAALNRRRLRWRPWRSHPPVAADPTEPPKGWDRVLWEQIQSLPEADRRVLALRVVAGLSTEESDRATLTSRAVSAADHGGVGDFELMLVDPPIPLADRHPAIAALADQPVVPPPPLDRVQERAASTRRRRRLLIGGAVMSAVVALIAVGSRGALPEYQPEPAAAPTTSTPPVTTDVVVPRGGPGSISLEPSTGLRNGQRITVRLPEIDSRNVSLFPCLADPGSSRNHIRRLCDTTNIDGGGSDADGSEFLVRRYLTTDAGTSIDCAAAGSRCVVLAAIWARRGVKIDSDVDLTGEIRVASLRFEPPNSPNRPRLLMIGSRPLTDGLPVKLQGIGFAPGEQISVGMCAIDLPGGTTCGWNGTVEVTADLSGRFRVPFLVYGEVHLSDRRVACSSLPEVEPAKRCVLFAQGQPSGWVTVRLDPIQARPPGFIRPKIEVDAPGPLVLGQSTKVRGTGFQAGEMVLIQQCRASGDESQIGCPDSEPTAATVKAGPDGTFEVASYTLPFDPACTAHPGACVLSANYRAATPLTFKLSG